MVVVRYWNWMVYKNTLLQSTDIVENINNLIEGKPMKDLIPWYRGFTGEIIPT